MSVGIFLIIQKTFERIISLACYRSMSFKGFKSQETHKKSERRRKVTPPRIIANAISAIIIIAVRFPPYSRNNAPIVAIQGM